jgi:hypothetical protein
MCIQLHARCWCLCTFTHTHTHIYIHVYLYIYISIYTNTHTHTHTHTYIYIYLIAFSDFFLKMPQISGSINLSRTLCHICTDIAAPKIPEGWRRNRMFFTLSLIVEGTTEKVSQFVVPLRSIYSSKMSFNEQKCIFWKLQKNNYICIMLV